MEFKKLSEVTLVEEATDVANVLIEENGEVKRVPKTEVGGMGYPTAIIKSSEYDNTLSGLQTASATVEITYECLNMTFEEAYEIMASGEILNVIGMLSGEGAINIHGMSMFTGSAIFGVPCIVVLFEFANLSLFWTADGLSTETPSTER